MHLVVLTSRFPYPLDKGDKLRIFNQIKELSKNHSITLIATTFSEVNKKEFEAVKQYCTAIHVFKISVFQQILNLVRSLFNGQPFQVGLFYSPAIHKKITTIIESNKPDAIYCHLIRMTEYVKNISGIRKTLDYMDVFSKGMQRRAERSSFPIKQAALIEYKRLLKYESAIFNYFDACTIISEQDRDLIPHPKNNTIHVIENGVDQSVFHPIAMEKKYDLLFTGNMGYPPNIEAAIYAATEILPLVHKVKPNVTLLIAGISPSVSVKKLANNNVFVIDTFEHIRDAFAMSKINLAPMLTSIGLQNKILQAMAMEMPTISSVLANNAVKAKQNVEIIEADEPQQYADAIIELLDNSEKLNIIAKNGYDFVLKTYDWKKLNSQLESIIFRKF